MASLLDDSLWCSGYGVIAILVILGNCLSIYLFLSSRRLRRMRTSILLLNLSAADLIIGSVTLPMFIALFWPGTNYALQKNVAFYMSFICIDVLTGFGSVFGLTAIALERLYSVFYPHHHRRATKRQYYVMVALTWALALLQTVLRILFDVKVISLDGFFSCVMTSLTTSLVLICAAYTAVWIKVNFKRARQVHRSNADSKNENKLAVTLTIITVIFIFTWVPFHVLNIVMFLCVECRTAVPHKYLNLVKLLHYSNSVINPIVYSSRFPEFRRTLKTMFFCKSTAVHPIITNVQPSRLSSPKQGVSIITM